MSDMSGFQRFDACTLDARFAPRVTVLPTRPASRERTGAEETLVAHLGGKRTPRSMTRKHEWGHTNHES